MRRFLDFCSNEPFLAMLLFMLFAVTLGASAESCRSCIKDENKKMFLTDCIIKTNDVAACSRAAENL